MESITTARLPTRFQSVPGWSIFAAVAVAAGTLATNLWLPDLNTLIKWWAVCFATTVFAGWRAINIPAMGAWRAQWIAILAIAANGVWLWSEPPQQRFGTSPARSSAGWAVMAISTDRDGDGFLGDATDCDDTDATKGPLSIDAPCGEGPKASSVKRTPVAEADHVFVFIVDAMRADVLEKHPEVVPNLVALANEGVVFENAYSPGNATLMSLPSILTGVSPVAMQDAMMSPELEIKHYQNGRWIFDLDARTCGAMLVQAHDYADWLFKAYPKPEVTLFFTDVNAFGHGAPNAVPRFKDALERCGDRRKTFVVYMDDPHIENDLKYGCKDGSRGGYTCYLEEISVVDAAMGQMIAELRSRPKMERTTIIVTSDHGEAFGEHAHVAHASSVYEEQVRVPLVIQHPRLKPSRVSVPVTTLGVAATVASETYSTRANQWYPSLLEALDGEYPVPITYNLVGMAKLAWTSPSAAIRVGNTKTMIDFVTGRTVSFDLESDPLEQMPLQAPPEMVEQLWKTHYTLSREAKQETR